MATCNCNPPIPPCPPKPQPFPAMSAHFAHTLDDMAEHYIQAQYIEVKEGTGVLAEKDLKTLLESRSNLLVYQGKVFRFSKAENNSHKYINVSTDGDSDVCTYQQITVNGTDGSWQISDLLSGEGKEIENVKIELGTFKEKVDNDISEINGVIDSLKADGGEIK